MVCPAARVHAGVVGAWPLKTISSALNKASGHIVPEWNPYMPKASDPGMHSAAQRVSRV